MAITKGITLPSGVTCEYHRIIEILAHVGGFRILTVESFVSKAFRDQGAGPVWTSAYQFPYDTWRTGWEMGVGPTPKDDYALLKTLPDFADAIDELSPRIQAGS